MLVSNCIFAQKDSVYFEKETDEMSDKVYFYPSRDIVLSDDGKTKGVRLSAFYNEKEGVTDLKCKLVNIGSCIEKCELIVMFKDSTKITMESWNDFNCKGNAWFSINAKDKKILSEKKILKVKITEKRDYNSYTSLVSDEDSDYYVQLFYADKNKKIRPMKK